MSVVLSEHLPLLASAPDGIQKLRGLILELAVRGKLVPQDPNDEPASELLKRTARERARLEAEGICKKSKPVPQVSEDQQPFAIPDGWLWVRLAAIASFENGDRSKNYPSRDEFIRYGIPFINAGHLLNRRVNFAEMNFIPQVRFDALKAGKTRKGDLLFCLRGSLGKFGIVVDDAPAAIASSLVIIRLYEEKLLHYVESYFSSPMITGQIAKFDNGTAQPNLGATDLTKFVFPLPPLAEQHRIVAKVDELMALCDRLESEQADATSAHARLVETLLGTLTQSTDAADLATNWQRLAEHFDTLFTTEASIDALKQTVLQLAVMGKLIRQDPADEPASGLVKRIAQERAKLEAVGICKKSKPMSLVSEDAQPFAVPDGWTWVEFDEIINPEKPISYGVLVPGPEVPDGVPFARIADLSITNPPTLPEKTIDRSVDAQYSRTRLEGGEILMGVVGSIGKLGIAPLSWKGANIARAICRIVPTPHVHKPFVLLLLQSKFMQSSFVGDTRTLAQPTLNVGLIRSALTPIPPLAEQQRIVATVDRLMALCGSLKADLGTARQRQATLADTLIESALEAA